MSFLEETSDFFTLVKESNFDLGLIYSQIQWYLCSSFNTISIIVNSSFVY